MTQSRAALRARFDRFETATADIRYQLPRAASRVLSLRFREALADLLWVRALLYFGSTQEQKRSPTWIADDIEDVVALNPDFKRAYRFGAVLSGFRNGRKRELVTRSIRFLEEGAKRFPDDWEFSFYVGTAYLVDMPAANAEERNRNRRMAADYIHHAVLLGDGRGAPDWLPNLSATLLTELGEKEAAVRQLEEVLAAAPDEATRAQVKLKLMQLKSRVDAEKLAGEVQGFVESWRRDFPYAPGDLYLLLGDRIRPRPLSWRALADGAFRASLTPDAPTEP